MAQGDVGGYLEGCAWEKNAEGVESARKNVESAYNTLFT